MQNSQAAGVSRMAKFGVGIFGGLAIGISALYQGKAGAAAADALGETGKGIANYIVILGIIESTALLTWVFLMLAIG